MKKFLSLSLVVGLLFLFWCTKNWATTPTDVTMSGNQQNEAERQTYENKKDWFSIQFPGNRTFEENVYGSAVMFFTPLTENDQLKENVGIIRQDLDKSYTLAEYYEITKPELINLIPGFSEISNETIKINGMDAQKLIYKGTQGSTNLQWEQIYLIKDKNVYIATYTATEKTFDEFAQKFDEMATTLEIK